MEDIIQTQQQLYDAINKIVVNIKKDSADRKSVDYFKRRLETLEAYWSDFQYNHDRLSTEASRSHPYFSNNVYESTYKLYNSTKSFINEQYQVILNQMTAEPSSNKSQPVEQESDIRVRRHTPPPELRSIGSSSRLDEMLKKQASNFRAFLRTISSIGVEHLTQKWELEDALKTLKTRWSTIDSLHVEMDSELEGSDESYDTTFAKHEARFNELKREINAKMWSVSHKDNWTPKMDIPPFSGDYKNWVSFKDLFTEVIHNNISIPAAQKMQFLKGKLRGEAERLVQHLQISSDNYSVTWEILNNRYNNLRMIFTSHANILLNLPVIQQPLVSHIKRVHDTTYECMNAIKNLGVETSSWDPLIVHILLQKLDTETHNHYLELLKNPRELPNLQDFLRFLENRFTMLESARKRFEHKSSNQNQNYINSKTHNYNTKQSLPANKLGQTLPNNNLTRICPLCKEQHGLYFCSKFLNMSPQLKCSTVKRLHVCENCLYDHKDKACISAKRCRECKAKHNTLLHEAFNNPTCNITIDDVCSRQSDDKYPTLQHSNSGTEILLATAMIKVQASNGSHHQMRALIDQGSQVSLISEKAAQVLALPRSQCKGVVSGIGTKESSCKGVIQISCTSLYNNFTFDTEVLVMNKLIKNLPSCTFSKPSWAHLEGIQLSDPDFNVSRPVDLLLGAEVYSRIIMDGISRSDIAVPIAQQTRLGWILCGNVQTLHCNVVLSQVDDLQRFWEIEDIADSSPLSEEDRQCVRYYKSTTKRHEDGSYEVRIPFKEDFETQLGASKHTAIAQFRQLEQKFQRNKNIEQQYKLFIKEYQALGQLKATISHQKPEFYLPHHCVIRDESTTTALRVVFNASRKTTTGLSLNDVMLKGPNLQQDLQSLLLKWRQFPCAFTADIEKMFRCIWVAEEDQSLQKIIWRDTLDSSLGEYQLCTVTYGTKAAPFLAMMTLKQLANDERSTYQDAAHVLEESFYMDDVLHGADSPDAALKLQQDLIQLLKLGGFNLRKWKSNCSTLLLNTTDNSHNFDFKQPDSSKTLGLRWNTKQDVFTFQSQVETIGKKLTKRSLLSDISKLYDPLGWLSPVSTKLKLLFQRVWMSNVQWDDRLSDELIKEWMNIREDIKNIDQFQIPRWLGTSVGSKQVELHGFCDASNKAYACVIYCKIQDNDNVKVTLVAGKARLAQGNKSITLPKLELSGALLLAKLMTKVQNCLSNHNIQTYGWTDSMVTLAWIQGEPGRWKPFVANRVKKICDNMPPNNWHYVKSAENPADCASRGISVAQLAEHSLWWQGPLWLREQHNDQNIPLDRFTTTEEARKVQQVNYISQDQGGVDIIDELLHKYRSIQKVTNVLAWVIRFVKRLKQDKVRHDEYLSLQEITNAKYKIIKHVQQREFTGEIHCLEQSKLLHSKSKLLSFNPFLCNDGLLRIGGRLQKANINQDMINPIIIPHSGRLTDLIIDYAHKLTLHGGARVTLATVRQKYWIIGGNRAVKKRLQTCVTCRKHNPLKTTQLMGDLPSQRCNQAKPFYHTGVDFTGHVMIKANKGRGIKTTKGYIAVFICMVTKLVHLELVSDLTASAFLAALRRMAARKGTPRHMYCDNGTNFVGASKNLSQEYQHILNTFDQEFKKEIISMEMEWHFNAPSWPSAGGLWEAAVKSVKYHLRRVIGEQRLTFEEYSTILAQVEAILNSRPLCPLTEDPNDLQFLTPSSFININQDMTMLETETDMRTRWYITQKVVQDVWKRWRSEYLSQLTSRSKWRQSRANININDVVTINDANLPPGKWAIGRVVELHPGSDGHVRVVTLRTKNGLIKRPVIKLSVLPVNEKRIEDDTTSRSKINKNQQKPATCSFMSLVTLLLFFMNVITSCHCSFNITQLKESQGLYFDKVADMKLIRDEWKIVSYYDMDTYWQGTTACNKYLKYLERLCSKLEGDSHCDVISTQLQLEFSELEYNNNIMLFNTYNNGTRRDKRRRRGLVNGVGYLANSLFGVLDDHFAEQYKTDIQLSRDNENHLASLIKNQTSIIEVEYNILKRTEDSLNKQHKMLNQLSLKFDKLAQSAKNQAERSQQNNEFTLAAIATSNMIRQLETIQTTLIDTLMDVYQGSINFHLISPNQLQATLSAISSHLTKDLSLPIHNLQSDFASIYKVLKIKAKMCKEYLIFELKIPLITRDSFEIMKLLSMPQVIGHSKMAKIVPTAEYVAISLRKESYLSMTTFDINSCRHDVTDEYLCYIHRPIYRLKTDEKFCRIDYGTGKCKFTVTPCTNEWTEINKVNKYMYFCCDVCNVRVLCDDQVLSRRLERNGILSIGQGCLIQTENFTIHAHNVGVSNLHIKPNLYAPDINPINQVIDINTTSSLTQNYSSQSEQLDDLRKQIETLKNSDYLASKVSYHDIHHYTIIYVLGGMALLVGVIVAIRRLRGRQRPRQAEGKVDQVTSQPDGTRDRDSTPGPSHANSGTRVYGISARDYQCNSNINSVSDNQNESAFSENSVPKVDKCVTPMPRKTMFN